jgi:hypothetical protein
VKAMHIRLRGLIEVRKEDMEVGWIRPYSVIDALIVKYGM